MLTRVCKDFFSHPRNDLQIILLSRKNDIIRSALNITTPWTKLEPAPSYLFLFLLTGEHDGAVRDPYRDTPILHGAANAHGGRRYTLGRP